MADAGATTSAAQQQQPADEHMPNYSAANVQATVEKYEERQRLARLLFAYRSAGKIRDKDTAAATQHQLAPLVLAELKNGRNTTRYREFVAHVFESGAPGITLDNEWASRRDRESSNELEKLQVALGQAQNTLQKEGIRVALMDMADHYFARGDYGNAMKQLARVKDSCSTPEHIAEFCLKACQTTLFNELGPVYSNAGQFVQRAEQQIETFNDTHAAAVRVASGIVSLDRKQYKFAANAFTSLRRGRGAGTTTLDIGPAAGYFMSASDFAMISTFTVLATYDRSELAKFLGDGDFKVALETEPELRSALTQFYGCQYHGALQTLQGLMPRMRLDPFFSSHAGALLGQIRQRALKQYVSPFVALDLNKMAATFHTDVAALEKELGGLIVRDVIQARIDKAAGVLRATQKDAKTTTLVNTCRQGQRYVRDTETTLRTLSMMRNGVTVEAEMRRLAPRQPAS